MKYDFMSLPPTAFKMQPVMLPAGFGATGGILPSQGGDELAQVTQRSSG